MRKITVMSTLKIVYVAMLAAMCVALSAVEIRLGETVKITFTYIPTFIAGAFLGPFAGALVGMVGDLLGFLIAPSGAFNPVFTLSSGLMGLIPGLVFKFLPFKSYIKIGLSFFLVYVICTLAVNTTAIYLMYIAKTGKAYTAYLITRMSTQTPVWAANVVLAYAVYYPIKKMGLIKLPASPPNDKKST